MQVHLTEQQARAVAAAARRGLEEVARGYAVPGLNSIGDEQEAYTGCNILEKAVEQSIGQPVNVGLNGKEPA